MSIGVSHAPSLRGRGTSVPEISWDPLRGMRNGDELLHGDKNYIGGKNLQVDHAACPGQNTFVTRMLTRDPFAVANLVFIRRFVTVTSTVHKMDFLTAPTPQLSDYKTTVTKLFSLMCKVHHY